MNTLKSAFIVVMLAGVLYAVYVVLSDKPAEPPAGMTQQDIDNMGPPMIEEGGGADTPLVESHESGGLDAETPPPTRLTRRDTPRGTRSSSSTNEPPAPSTSSPATEEPSAYGGGSLPDDAPLENPAARSKGGNLPERKIGYESPARTEAPGLVPSADSEPATNDQADPASSETANEDAARLLAWNLKRDWASAEAAVQKQKFADALALLTPYCREHLAEEDRAKLLTWLDGLSAKVVFSREHLVLPAYRVQSTRERLATVASSYHVSTQLLLNINADVVRDPDVLLPGTELKVVPGPFHAELDLRRSEVTLFMTDRHGRRLYACRFPFAVGDEPPAVGKYEVTDRRQGYVYSGSDGRAIPANDPTNPYGNVWLDLGGRVCLHGSPREPSPGPVLGCVAFSTDDAQDLMALLTVGSEVTIRD